MSGSISGAASGAYGLLATLVRDGAATREQLNRLTTQAGSGLVAQSYDGLGAAAAIPLSLGPQVANLDTWQNGISQAITHMQATQTAMSRIQGVAASILSQLPNLNGLSAAEVDGVAQAARSGLEQVAALLNTEVGGVYVFAGTDTATPPISNPDQILSSGFAAAVGAAVSNLSTAGGPATMTTALRLADPTAAAPIPFSAALQPYPSGTAPDMPKVQTAPDTLQSYSLLASANTWSTSANPGTTGSYMRDLMGALAMLGSLSGAQASDPNLPALARSAQTTLNGVVGAMADDVGTLGNQQTALTNTQTAMVQAEATLKTQISGVQDADMAQTLSSISLVQVRLQASYQLIGTLSSLTLSKFLPIG